jgi:hypothetical protein
MINDNAWVFMLSEDSKAANNNEWNYNKSIEENQLQVI